jgi:hypothetical protein
MSSKRSSSTLELRGCPQGVPSWCPP